MAKINKVTTNGTTYELQDYDLNNSLSKISGIVKSGQDGSLSKAVAGTDYDYPVLKGTQAPTTSTVGAVGQHYLNTSATQAPYEWVCVKKSGSTYTWVEVGGFEGGVINHGLTIENSNPMFSVIDTDSNAQGALWQTNNQTVLSNRNVAGSIANHRSIVINNSNSDESIDNALYLYTADDSNTNWYKILHTGNTSVGAPTNLREGYLRYFISLTPLGVTKGEETIASIIAAMPNYSMLMLQVNTESDGYNPATYPSAWGLLTIKRYTYYRVEIDYMDVKSSPYRFYKKGWNNGTERGWYELLNTGTKGPAYSIGALVNHFSNSKGTDEWLLCNNSLIDTNKYPELVSLCDIDNYYVGTSITDEVKYFNGLYMYPVSLNDDRMIGIKVTNDASNFRNLTGNYWETLTIHQGSFKHNHFTTNIFYLNGYYIVSCDDGYILYSNDLYSTEWTSVQVGGKYYNVRNMDYYNGTYVAAIYDSTTNYVPKFYYATSLNGPWKQADISSAANLRAVSVDICCHNGTWVGFTTCGVSGATSAFIVYTTNVTGTWSCKQVSGLAELGKNIIYFNGYWLFGATDSTNKYPHLVKFDGSTVTTEQLDTCPYNLPTFLAPYDTDKLITLYMLTSNYTTTTSKNQFVVINSDYSYSKIQSPTVTAIHNANIYGFASNGEHEFVIPTNSGTIIGDHYGRRPSITQEGYYTYIKAK